MYMIYVPLIGIAAKRFPKARIWIAVALAVCGMYLMNIKAGEFSLNRGDVLVFLCGLVFAAHIIVISIFSPLVDGVKLSCVQFFVASVISIPLAFATEVITADAMLIALPAMLYVGIMSGGAGYTLQIVAQRDADPAIASLLMSMESVFALVGGAIVLGERMSVPESVGCALMFAAIIISQLPDRRLRS
jgi:drug/metabolite transporter (DMT)-like permease